MIENIMKALTESKRKNQQNPSSLVERKEIWRLMDIDVAIEDAKSHGYITMKTSEMDKIDPNIRKIINKNVHNSKIDRYNFLTIVNGDPNYKLLFSDVDGSELFMQSRPRAEKIMMHKDAVKKTNLNNYIRKARWVKL